jgi:hypothetical protein
MRRTEKSLEFFEPIDDTSEERSSWQGGISGDQSVADRSGTGQSTW